MKIVYSSGFMLDSAGCKVLHFVAALMTHWPSGSCYTLHCSTSRSFHPLREAQNLDCQKHSLKVVAALWVAGVAVHIPVLISTGKSEY